MAMKSMVAPYFTLLSVMLLVASTTACTTSTRLIQSKVSVDKSALLTEAAPSVKQSDEINKQTNVATNTPTTAAINAQDYEHTLSRLTPLAEKGQADAQYSLGYMHYNGLGVPRNNSLAIKWLASAAKQGHENAIEALRRIALADSTAAQDNEPAKDFEQIPKLNIAGNDASREVKTQVTSTPRLPEATTDAMARTLTIAPQPSLTKNEQWIMGQPGKRYTIQLVATANKAAMLRFIDRNNLRSSAVYYKTKRKNDDWYTLILGSFESLSAAKKTINRLSPTLRKTKPWVKPISGIQKALAVR